MFIVAFRSAKGHYGDATSVDNASLDCKVHLNHALGRPRLRTQRFEMGFHGAGQDGHVVTALEDADDPPIGVSRRDRYELFGQDLEIFDLQSEVADGVFGMCIEARADQDELRFDLVRETFQASSKCRMVCAARRSMGQGDVGDISKSGPRAGFIAGSGSRIERVTMNGKKANASGIVEDFLRAIAVMDIEIGDQDSVEIKAGDGIGRRECDVGIDAKTHPFGRPRVMPGRSDETKRPSIDVSHYKRNRLDARAGCKSRGQI